ncbi:MAG: hypothetical protein K6G11_04445 [Lachnospiraceae bacterium]|nr:hypothetical protein [Lachnospiraceae bacterium]
MGEQGADKKKPLVRFGEFDLLKAMAILGLPAVHIMEEAMEAGVATKGLIEFSTPIIGLCVFGPSLFMICMGFGIGGSAASPKIIRKNGIQFLLIGAILNIVRWFIPGVIESIVTGDKLVDDISFCLVSDIYYFVGLFFIAYSFLKKLKLDTAGIMLISVLTLSLNTFLTPVTGKYIKNEIVSALVGNIVYVDETSCFPLLSWLIFPCVGVLLGEVLKKSDEEKREIFMKRTLDFSVTLLIAFTIFLYNYDIDIIKVVISPVNDYITDFPNVILLICFALILICLVYYLCKIIGASKFMAFMLKISTFIMPFYLLQWVIIAWIFYGMSIFGAPEGCFNILMFIVSVVVVTAICIFVTITRGMRIMKYLLKITSFKKKKKKKKKA